MYESCSSRKAFWTSRVTQVGGGICSPGCSLPHLRNVKLLQFFFLFPSQVVVVMKMLLELFLCQWIPLIIVHNMLNGRNSIFLPFAGHSPTNTTYHFVLFLIVFTFTT